MPHRHHASSLAPLRRLLLGVSRLAPLAATFAVGLLMAACEPAIGDPCETNLDCPSGAQCDTTAPDGYCFIAGCDDNKDCPESVCVAFDPWTSFCMDGCSGNSDCRSGYTCRADVGNQRFCYVAVPAEEAPFERAIPGI